MTISQPHLITVPAGVYSLTIAGTLEDDGLTGDIDITDDLTISGAGAESTRLDAAALDRYFHAPSVNVAVSITLRDLTIENGMAITGGGIRVGSGDLTIENAALVNNVANDANGGNGGAVSIARGEALVVSDSLIQGNTAHTGGGIFSSGVETTITDTTIADNHATQGGGGVQVADALLIADRITVSGNSVKDGGGGGMQTFRSEMQVTNSTISGNSAFSTKGAGLSFGSGVSTLLHVTVVDNIGGYGVGGDFGDATLENVIIANNAGGDCQTNVVVSASGGNLDSDGSCSVALTAPPQIGPLADNGGPTQTHGLLPGSPAIDAASGCPPPATDQRGEPRPQGNGCDLGAFEAEEQKATGDDDTGEGPPDDGIGGGLDIWEVELDAGGQFVFWQHGSVNAADVFGGVKIAWLWNAVAFSWSSFIPDLGITNWTAEDGAFLWVVTFGDLVIIVEG